MKRLNSTGVLTAAEVTTLISSFTQNQNLPENDKRKLDIKQQARHVAAHTALPAIFDLLRNHWAQTDVCARFKAADPSKISKRDKPLCTAAVVLNKSAYPRWEHLGRWLRNVLAWTPVRRAHTSGVPLLMVTAAQVYASVARDIIDKVVAQGGDYLSSDATWSSVAARTAVTVCLPDWWAAVVPEINGATTSVCPENAADMRMKADAALEAFWTLSEMLLRMAAEQYQEMSAESEFARACAQRVPPLYPTATPGDLHFNLDTVIAPGAPDPVKLPSYPAHAKADAAEERAESNARRESRKSTTRGRNCFKKTTRRSQTGPRARAPDVAPR